MQINTLFHLRLHHLTKHLMRFFPSLLKRLTFLLPIFATSLWMGCGSLPANSTVSLLSLWLLLLESSDTISINPKDAVPSISLLSDESFMTPLPTAEKRSAYFKAPFTPTRISRVGNGSGENPTLSVIVSQSWDQETGSFRLTTVCCPPPRMMGVLLPLTMQWCSPPLCVSRFRHGWILILFCCSLSLLLISITSPPTLPDTVG